MKLSETLQQDFLSADRQRGQLYYRCMHVGELSQKDNIISACVDGSYGDYQVTIDVGNLTGSDGLQCTCPRYDDGYNCKHIWATILKIDQQSANRISPSVGRAQKVVTRVTKKKAKRRGTAVRKATPDSKVAAKQPPRWQQVLSKAAAASPSVGMRSYGPLDLDSVTKSAQKIFYVIDVSDVPTHHNSADSIVLHLLQQEMRKTGEWGKIKSLSVQRSDVDALESREDRQILQALIGIKPRAKSHYEHFRDDYSQFELPSNLDDPFFRTLQDSGRFYWTLSLDLGIEDFRPVVCDRDGDFAIALEVVDDPDGSKSTMEVCLRRGQERVGHHQVVRIAKNGLALLDNRLVSVNNPKAQPLLNAFQSADAIEIAKQDRDQFVTYVSSIKSLPDIHLPESWSVDSGLRKQQPQLSLRPSKNDPSKIVGDISFRYDEYEFPFDDSKMGAFDTKTRRWIRRDINTEREWLKQLEPFPITDVSRWYYRSDDIEINSKHFQSLVSSLADLGWRILWAGHQVKRPGIFNISVSSGTDWFDLNATVDYDGETIALPALLAALRSNEHYITLADGSKGRLPDDLLQKYAQLAEFGEIHDESIRFRPTQAMLLDAMLSSQENVVLDKDFLKYRKKLQSFSGIEPKDPPRGFQGDLREYQRDGLGWLHFLREFGLGGCLADDMGLGKTIQVLALLESQRVRRISPTTKMTSKVPPSKRAVAKEKTASAPQQTSKHADLLKQAVSRTSRKPSIIVVPKSLIFNWLDEAAKFTPKLRLLNYTGTERHQTVADSDGFDVILTTYGTMRKDIANLAKIDFDYAILDESQAIKNSAAQAAKASRLLTADHRLALTGTPIENHLGELWSLFEFLNPGMLGRSKAFATLTKRGAASENPDTKVFQTLAQGLRPFLLRRTKDQVLKDLPPKTEQTLYCDMTKPQRKQYDELKEYYRVKLAKDIETLGMEKSKIQVLEALLRLRQVACDPRLLDPTAKPGAKLEILMQQLSEVIEEGHKVLVFSQFTSLLALLRSQLDDAGIGYEYLDGKTANRAAKVKSFQDDPEVRLFLISLKAGGNGLNLTAADYVYLLDPWWNPAVEAQAIDRAHRMGQTQSVMAYRIICRDTVEEQIVTLQKSKRELADSIITADDSLIRTLTTDDLQLLLG